MTLSATDQLTQLEAARQLVLADSALYPQIVQGILPIVGASARLELRRWGAEFLAETFASPALGSSHKESLSVTVLPTLKELLELEGEDTTVVKSVVQAAASIYGFVFRYMYVKPKLHYIVDSYHGPVGSL
jgi:symplekin